MALPQKGYKGISWGSFDFLKRGKPKEPQLIPFYLFLPAAFPRQVCIYVYIYIYIGMCAIGMCVYIYIYIYIYIYMYKFSIGMCVYIYIYIHAADLGKSGKRRYMYRTCTQTWLNESRLLKT